MKSRSFYSLSTCSSTGFRDSDTLQLQVFLSSKYKAYAASCPVEIYLEKQGLALQYACILCFQSILIFVYYIIIAGETTSKIYAVKKGNQLYAQLQYS